MNNVVIPYPRRIVLSEIYGHCTIIIMTRVRRKQPRSLHSCREVYFKATAETATSERLGFAILLALAGSPTRQNCDERQRFSYHQAAPRRRMHGTVGAATATGEYDAARRRDGLVAPAGVARAVNPTAADRIAEASIFAPPLPSTAPSANGSQVATIDILRRDSTVEEYDAAAEIGAVRPTFYTGKGTSGPVMMTAASCPTPGFRSTEEAVRPVSAVVETARRATMLRGTVTDVSGAGSHWGEAVDSAAEASQAERRPSTLFPAFSAGRATATAHAAAADATASGTKVVYIIPEQTPPAVRLVLGRRSGWTEWDAEIHGADEVSEVTHGSLRAFRSCADSVHPPTPTSAYRLNVFRILETLNRV